MSTTAVYAPSASRYFFLRRRNALRAELHLVEVSRARMLSDELLHHFHGFGGATQFVARPSLLVEHLVAVSVGRVLREQLVVQLDRLAAARLARDPNSHLPAMAVLTTRRPRRWIADSWRVARARAPKSPAKWLSIALRCAAVRHRSSPRPAESAVAQICDCRGDVQRSSGSCSAPVSPPACRLPEFHTPSRS